MQVKVKRTDNLEQLREDEMEVTILTFKPSGKFYSSRTVRGPRMEMFEDRWIRWLKNQLRDIGPIVPGATYITLSTDADLTNRNFHTRLWREEELFVNNDEEKAEKEWKEPKCICDEAVFNHLYRYPEVREHIIMRIFTF